eukprot:gene15296-20604_t
MKRKSVAVISADAPLSENKRSSRSRTPTTTNKRRVEAEDRERKDKDTKTRKAALKEAISSVVQVDIPSTARATPTKEIIRIDSVDEPTIVSSSPNPSDNHFSTSIQKNSVSKRVSLSQTSPTPSHATSVAMMTRSARKRQSIGTETPLISSLSSVQPLSASKSQASIIIHSANPTSFQLIEPLADEAEITIIWNQSLTALMLCMGTIGPLFLALITAFYCFGLLFESQLIASVGVVYAYIFLLIMGSYGLFVLPVIVISRIFTSLVAPPESRESDYLFYARCGLLFGITVLGLTFSKLF